MMKQYEEDTESMSEEHQAYTTVYVCTIPYVSMHFQKDGMTPGC